MTLLRSLLVLSLGIAGTVSAEPTPAVFPFEPAQLLTTLPAAQPEWTVIRSEADSSLGDWVETKATRVFAAPTGVPSGPAGEAEISVTDTAGFTPSLANFANFTAGKSGNVEKKLTGSLPTIIVTAEEGRQLTQVLVSGRYIVEILLTRTPQSRIEDWLRAFRFDLLPPKSATPTARPREFRLSHVDELHPENNRSYSVSTTSSKRVSNFLKTLPPEKSE
jgi:hypothetical protein